ncbi:MAG: MBL fold metallo-hydrolase [Candidatus Delongbacteria bacterium]|nr:MBL fold metallo-hydrolase [Candidatus Delongbacteria bacterium]
MFLIPLCDTTSSAANSFYLNLDDVGVLLDAGLAPESWGDASLPAFDHLYNWPLDHIFISHVHSDHAGSLPLAAQLFWQAAIHMTSASAALLPRMMERTASLMEEQYNTGISPTPALYDDLAVEPLYSRIVVQQLNQPVEWHNRNNDSFLTAELFDAGHLLGSAGLLLKSSDTSFFYTGDNQLREMGVMRGSRFPTEAEIVLMECSNAGTAEEKDVSRRDEINRLATALVEVLRLGGRVLLPTGSLGRAQELLYILYHLKRGGNIPAVPIYVSNSIQEFSIIHDRFLLFQNGFRFTDAVVDIYNQESGGIADEPAIYLLPAALMWSGSSSLHLAAELLPHTIDAVFFVGHTGENCPAHDLQLSAVGDPIQLENGTYTRNCRLETFHFSAHSSPRHLLEMVRRIGPRKVILFKGRSPEAAEVMYNRLRLEYRDLTVLIPELGEIIKL